MTENLKANHSCRLDKFISDSTEISRTLSEKLIADGKVTVNGKSQIKKYLVKIGDEVVIDLPPPTTLEILPQNIPIDIVYEDSELLVVNKPKGMVVHPAPGNYHGTMVNALLFHCQLSSINGVIRPGIVHRIDKNTSGLLIVAKTDSSHIFLSEQIAAHSFKRQYRAIVCGNLEQPGTVNAPIGRSTKDRQKMAVTDKNSKNAVTHYDIIENYGKYTELKITLETGRTHQIRVHMAYIGRPVLGDDVYGKTFPGIDGQCLHAETIGFIHPNGEYLEFSASLPNYFNQIRLRLQDCG